MSKQSQPAAVDAFEIPDLLGGADGCLGRFLHEGRELDRQGAIDEALYSAEALTDAISTLAQPDAARTAEQLDDMTLYHLGVLAHSLVKRAQYLRHDVREGGEGA